MRSKVCVRCNQDKPLGDYYRRAKAADGLSAACKPCLADRRRERRGMTDDDRAAESLSLATRATKVCGSCGIEKSRPEFSKLARNRDGLDAWCKTCKSAYSSRHYRANAQTRAAQARAWREANADTFKAAQQAYYLAHKPEFEARWKAWSAANPERRQEIHRRRRARLARVSVGSVDLDALWTGACGICGSAIDPDLRAPDPMSRSIDHIVPISRGGAHAQANLQWAHLVCNIRKGARMPDNAA